VLFAKVDEMYTLGTHLHSRNLSRDTLSFSDMQPSFVNWNAIGSEDALSGREDKQDDASDRGTAYPSQHASILRSSKIKVSDIGRKIEGSVPE